MDPITLMATITASYNGLKKAVAMGREVQDIVKQLGKWAEGADQMYSWIKNQETKKPGLFQAIKFDKSDKLGNPSIVTLELSETVSIFSLFFFLFSFYYTCFLFSFKTFYFHFSTSFINIIHF